MGKNSKHKSVIERRKNVIVQLYHFLLHASHVVLCLMLFINSKFRLSFFFSFSIFLKPTKAHKYS